MPTPARAKPPVPAWIVRERKRLGLKPADVAQRMTEMGCPVTEGTVRTWEAGRSPHPDNVECLERLFGTQAPGFAATGADQNALIAALERQTAAITELVSKLDSLANQAIREGIVEALREAGALRAGEESPPEQLPGR